MFQENRTAWTLVHDIACKDLLQKAFIADFVVWGDQQGVGAVVGAPALDEPENDAISELGDSILPDAQTVAMDSMIAEISYLRIENALLRTQRGQH